MDIMQIVALISAAGTVSGIIFAYVGYRKGIKQEGSSEGSLRSDVGYIKAGVDELKSDFKEQRQNHYELADTVARIDESAKSAHHRIDGIETRVNSLERMEANNG